MNIDFYPFSTQDWNQVIKDISNKILSCFPEIKLNYTWFEFEDTCINLSLTSFDKICSHKDFTFTPDQKLKINNVYLSHYFSKHNVYCDIEFKNCEDSIPQKVSIHFDIEERIYP